MITYLVRRLAISIILLAIVSLLSFAIIRFAPGSKTAGGEEMSPKKLAAAEEARRAKYHLNDPWYSQYFLVMKDLFSNKLVDYNDRPVHEQIVDRLPWTMLLNAVSLVLVFGMGIPLGVAGARFRGGWRDTSSAVGAFFLLSLPGFFVSYMLCILLVKYIYVPILGVGTFGMQFSSWWQQALDTGWHLFAPALVLALPGVAVQSRYVRASLIESLSEDYIRTARAKGLSESVVYYKHALRNSLRPMVTFFGFLLAGMIAGSVIVETIFSYPGMGRLAYEALSKRNLPVLVAINFYSAVLVVMGNLLADMLYSVVDPRVRLE
ncbi:MAG: ABC transporter permease [Phycisphaerae bacterium]|nr:ABC transporter permease [Phycisphaerae bacterium]